MSESFDLVKHIEPQFQAQLKEPQPDWLRALRKTAWQLFSEHGVPNRKHEEWKYTPTRTLARTPFVQSAPPQQGQIEALGQSAFVNSNPTLGANTSASGAALRVVLWNGHICAALSSFQDVASGANAGNGVQLLRLSEILRDPEHTAHAHVRQALSTACDRLSGHPLDALNFAMFREGVWLHVSKQVQAETPIEILYAGNAEQQPVLGAFRTMVHVEAHAEATLVERFVGVGEITEQPYFSNHSTALFVDEGAHLRHYKVQEEHTHAYHMAMTRVHQKANSNFTNIAVSFGGKVARHEVESLLDGQNIETTLDGLYVVDGNRFIENRTFLDHAKPHCNSFELYKGLLFDQGRGAFNGKILVRQDAQKTDAKQSNQSLLLSDDAQIFAKPQLEIYADDVKCTHGSTTGSLDAQSLFYARSRGIPQEMAKGMLTYAFANAVLETIQVPVLREQLHHKLATFCGGGGVHIEQIAEEAQSSSE
ncbi:MAG: Fe-S cluster assembly protein SufD [Myxococcota bacterium]